MNVAEMFEKPAGALHLDRRGRWWINRSDLAVVDGEVEVVISDGAHTATIAGTPEILTRLAAAITAQVMGAQANSADDPAVRHALRDAGLAR